MVLVANQCACMRLMADLNACCMHMRAGNDRGHASSSSWK